MARSLEDVVRRRTELGLARPLRTDALRAAAELMAAELDWDGARVEREVERTLRSLEALPGGRQE